MEVDMMEELETITAEAAEELRKEQAEAGLIPEGKFEGLVITHSKTDEASKGENSSWKGIPVYRVGVKFFDCPEVGKTKTQFFNLTTQKVMGNGGRPKTAYTAMVGLMKSLGMLGQPVTEALEQAKVTRLKYNVSVTPENENGERNNYLRGISAL